MHFYIRAWTSSKNSPVLIALEYLGTVANKDWSWSCYHLTFLYQILEGLHKDLRLTLMYSWMNHLYS
jgi:hypothetical protein